MATDNVRELRAPMLNQCTFAGNMGNTPKVNDSGKVAFFTVFVRGGAYDKTGEWQDASFPLNCKVLGDKAVERFEKSGIGKGCAVIVSGQLHLNEYENKDGDTVKNMELIVGNIQSLERIEKPKKSMKSEHERKREKNNDDDTPF